MYHYFEPPWTMMIPHYKQKKTKKKDNILIILVIIFHKLKDNVLEDRLDHRRLLNAASV